jgi:Fe-S cluster assembly scaffold protein SufB
VTETATADAATAPRRPARRSPTELTFRLDPELVEAFAAEEPDWLAADRRSALAAFQATPLEPNQLYTTYLDLRNAELGDVRPYESPAGTAAQPGEVPADAAGIAVFEEDGVTALALSDDVRAAGVTLETLGSLIARDPGVARRLLVHETSLPADDAFARITQAGWNQGLVVRVPAGVRLERPIVVRWAAGAAGRALLTRTVIELGDGAHAAFVEELVPSPAATTATTQALFTASTELHLGADSRLGLASLQGFGPRQVVFQHRNARLGEGAELRWALAQLGSRLVRSRVDNVLAGDRSTVEQVEVVFGSGDQLHDLTSYTRHVGRDTTGQLLSKGVLLDAARAYLKGMISIEKTAIGTDSYLGEFGMNLSKRARSVAIPSLEIDQPDCRRAAHASSVGPIDESQLFYLESRGIPPDEARKFIVLGFLEPVVSRVPLADAQDRLREALETKWDESWGAEAASAA